MFEIQKLNSILYVEDNKETQKELTEFLTFFCIELFVANNGQEGLALYKENTIDLVISDIKMPLMDGILMCKEIKKINKNQKIVLLTAFNELEYLQQAIDLHVNGYIKKPINLEVLEQKIDDISSALFYKKNKEEKNKELETIFETTNDGIAIVDLETNFLFCNDAFSKMLGYTKEELYKLNSIELGIKEKKDRSVEVLNKILQKGHFQNYEKIYRTKDGDEIIVDMNVTLMPDNKRLLLAARDTTEQKEQQRLLDGYINIIEENVLTTTTDIDGIITYVSNAVCKTSEYSKEELVGSKHNILKDSSMPQEIYKELWETIVSDKTWEGELKNKKKNGESYWIYLKITPIYDKHKYKIGYTSIMQNITDKKRIEELAITDGLTSLFNRRYFDEIFPKAINSARREQEFFTFILIDIDYFKQYNDTYGHQAGDKVLISVAQCLQQEMKRSGDLVFRLGGEEFGIICKTDKQEKAILHANRLKDTIENLHIVHEKNDVSQYVTVSMGLICDKAHNLPSFDKVYHMADKLLYKSKDAGRNIVSANIFQ